MTERIHFIITGGTIDSKFSPSTDTVVPRDKSIIPDILKMIGLSEKNAVYSQVCLKDSRNITTEDRDYLFELIQSSPELQFIVTHGTYTMVDTARYIEKRLKTKTPKKEATVIFTGSMIPIEGFCPSDGTFNLGYAIAEIRHLPSGVYVCMNVRTFTADEALKDLSQGRFISLLGEK